MNGVLNGMYIVLNKIYTTSMSHFNTHHSGLVAYKQFAVGKGNRCPVLRWTAKIGHIIAGVNAAFLKQIGFCNGFECCRVRFHQVQCIEPVGYQH